MVYSLNPQDRKNHYVFSRFSASLGPDDAGLTQEERGKERGGGGARIPLPDGDFVFRLNLYCIFDRVELYEYISWRRALVVFVSSNSLLYSFPAFRLRVQVKFILYFPEY